MARRDPDFDYDDPLAGPGRGKRWLIRLGMLAVLLVALYFLLTSGFMLRRVIIPRLTASLNGTVSVGEVSLSPFSRFYATDLKVRLHSGETVLAAKEVEVRYGLISFLRNRWIIPEIRLVAPELNVVRRPDGTTSLDTLTRSGQSRGGPPPQLPEELLIGRVTLTDGVLNYEQRLANGERTHILLRGINLDLTNLGNEREATLKLAAQLGLARQPAAAQNPQAAGRIAFDLQSAAQLKLSASLQPTDATISARLATREAQGSYARLAGLVGTFEGQLVPGALRKCELRFQRGKASLGRLTISGPVDWKRKNMRLRLQLSELNHEVLDLLGSPFGLAFGHTRIVGDALVDLSNNGEVINASTTLNVSRLGIHTPRGAAPELDLRLKVDGRVQLGLKAADIRAFSFTAREGNRPLLQLRAPRAINLLWDPTIRPSINESSLEVNLNQLNLARWRPLFGPGLPDGILNIQGVITNQDDGRRLRAWLTNRLEGLTFRAGGFGVTNASVQLETLLQFKDFLSLSAEELTAKVALGGAPVLDFDGSASYEFGNDELRVQFEAHGNPRELAARFPNPWVEAQAGALRMDGTVRFFGSAKMIATSVILEDFVGRLERYHFNGQRLQLDCSMDWTPEVISLRQVGITSGQGAAQSGSAYVGGHYRPATGEGRFDLVLANLNPAAVAPFLAAHFPDLALVDGSLDGDARLEISPTGRRSCSVRVETKRLTFLDRQSRRRQYPLDLKGELALIESDGVVEILTNVVSLPATKTAANRIQMEGRLNLAPTNAEPGRLVIHAAALDLSSLVDFYRTNQPVAEAALPPSPAPAPAPPAAEPAAAPPEVPPLIADLNVGKLFIHRLTCSNLVARAVVTNGLARLDPCRLNVGGGRLSARAVYPLSGAAPGDFQLRAEHLPVEPLSVAFLGSPRGRYLGELNTSLAYRSLNGPPEGSFQFNLTNLTFRLLPRWTRDLLTPVAALLHADELLRSPLRHIEGQAQLAGDTVDLRNFSVVGDLFMLRARGQVKLADSWTQSTLHLPVDLALNERVVRRLGLKNLPADPQTGFVQLPSFLTVEGTLGSYTNKTDATRLSGLLAGALGRSIGGDAGNAIETLGNLLQGTAPPSPDGAPPAAQDTNSPLPFLPGLLDTIRNAPHR